MRCTEPWKRTGRNGWRLSRRSRHRAFREVHHDLCWARLGMWMYDSSGVESCGRLRARFLTCLCSEDNLIQTSIHLSSLRSSWVHGWRRNYPGTLMSKKARNGVLSEEIGGNLDHVGSTCQFYRTACSGPLIDCPCVSRSRARDVRNLIAPQAAVGDVHGEHEFR